MNEPAQTTNQYETYIEFSPTPLFVANKDAHYVFVNKAAAELLGYSREELLTFTFNNIIFKEDTNDIFSSFEVLKKEGKLTTEVRLKARDGRAVNVKLNAVALPTGNVLAFCEDITYIKDIEQELKEKIAQLEKSNKFMFDREVKMVELKQEIESLKKQINNT